MARVEPPNELMTAIRLAFFASVALATLGVAQAPPPRAGHVMTSAGPGGGVFLLGGQIIDDTPRVIDTLWFWNGASWRAVSDRGPRNRTLPGAAFDSRRGVLVVYGGLGIGSGTRYGDTWEWNGTRWDERAVRTPGARDHHAMAYDESRGNVVLYGGVSRVGQSDTFPNDTWTYDGRTWQLADSTTGPGGLVHHAMAYDARRQRVVLFGGSTAQGRRTADVWEWDGAKWQPVTVSGESPGARSHHRMAFDAARGVIVLYGGDETGDTWTWDGTRWTRHTVPGPPARNVHAMAYDMRRQRVVLFGGGANRGGMPPYGYLNDLWEWDGARWVSGIGSRE